MYTNNNLNLLGQICLASSVTVSVNLIVHPLCTIKNRMMANLAAIPSVGPPLRFGRIRRLYGGFPALCIAESAYNGVTYVIHNHFGLSGYDPMYAAMIAGTIASPVSAIGEALMIDRQVNDLSFLRSIRRAIRWRGIIATIFREMPFTVALLGGAPKIENILPISNDVTRQIVGGVFAGVVAGVITTPFDRIKTLVQANNETLLRATTTVFGCLRSREGVRRMMREVFVRSTYIGLSVALMNLFNNQFAQHFPAFLRR